VILATSDLSFHGVLPPAAGIVLLVLAAAGIVWLYAKEQGKVGPLGRAVMALFRIAVVGTALFLLMRPVLVAETKVQKPRGVVLLLDNSLSMTQRDQRLSEADRLRVALAEDRVAPDAKLEGALPAGTSEDPSRADVVRAVLKNPRLKLLGSLERGGPVKVAFFGQRLRGLPDEAAERGKAPTPLAERIAREFRTEETQTSLADAVHELVTKNEGDAPGAIIVVTDGQDNASRRTLEEAAEVCARHRIPLHLYGVGSSEVGNLELKDFLSPETVFFDDTVSVPVRWRCRGFKQGAAELVLSLGGRPVARKDVALKEGEEFREVLQFTPRKTGGNEEKSEFAVSIRFKGQETFVEDNELKRPVTLVDRRVGILYVEGTPRWEYKFLMPALLRDRRVDAKFLLAEGDRRALAAGGPYLTAFPATRGELFAYDVLILGDVALAFIGAEKVAWIRDFVREGGSLIFMAGRRHAPSEYAASPLAEVLPVEFGSARFPSDTERTQVYVPVLTRAGGQAEMLSLADTPDESARVWQTLPGFYWAYPVQKLRAGAAALLVHPRLKAGDQPMPVMATQFYGKGQVLFLGTDESWRWRANGGDKVFGRFWGQLIYQMGLPHVVGTPKRVQVALERPENVLGRPGYVYARVFDAEFKPYAGERVNARLERLDAKPGEERTRAIALDPAAGQPGEYRALLPHDAVGRFALRIDEPASATLEYRVGLPPQHELQVAGMAVEELQSAALASGGRFYREEDLHRLAANLEPRTATLSRRSETLLWNAPVLLVFVALIAVEWILRKFSNLS
jgi:uncharacterized membrane protein